MRRQGKVPGKPPRFEAPLSCRSEIFPNISSSHLRWLIRLERMRRLETTTL
ncbi:hypothetical protein [Methanomethylovorans sp.]|uniref:hypothetical protein n=1 Tax=Methanomethylovorans sp. TaxID=2758717 RepID=UPI00351C768E